MGAQRLGQRTLLGSNLALALGAGLLLILAAQVYGLSVLLLGPLLLVAIVLLARPLAAMAVTVVAVALAEGSAFGLFGFTQRLYGGSSGFMYLDGLVLLAVVAVGLDVLRSGRPIRAPAVLALPLGLLALAMVAGIVTGKAAGVGMHQLILGERGMGYLIVLTLAVVNLDLDARQIALVLRGALGLAILKALLGLAAVGSGRGYSAFGSSRITYYEPTGNWIVLVALLGIVAALVARLRPPLWLALACLPLAASLVLSFRRSFWIGGLVGVALVVVFALSPTGRRLIVPAGLLVAVGIALLGSISIQSQSPLAERVQSLNPTHVEANAEDRYRLDERANVVEEIKRHPISGLGVDVPWSATVRSLPVEHQNGRLYTHVVTLYLWLKLGILGPIAYLTLIAGAVVLSWRAWRRQHEPLFRCFGLASLCGLAGLFVIETTASFTGVDVRFTVMLAAELGLLGALAAIEPRSASAPRS